MPQRGRGFIPLDRLDAHLHRIVHDAGGRMVLLCQSGARAATAAEKLGRAGLTDSAVLEGGMNASSTPTSTLRWPASAVDTVDRTREVARRSRRMVHW